MTWLHFMSVKLFFQCVFNFVLRGASWMGWECVQGPAHWRTPPHRRSVPRVPATAPPRVLAWQRWAEVLMLYWPAACDPCCSFHVSFPTYSPSLPHSHTPIVQMRMSVLLAQESEDLSKGEDAPATSPLPTTKKKLSQKHHLREKQQFGSKDSVKVVNELGGPHTLEVGVWSTLWGHQ